MRKRGEGCVFQRSDSRFWWLKYADHGKPIRQPTDFLVNCGNAKRNATAHRNAERLLQQKLAEIKTGTYTPPSVERVKVSELADEFFRDYRINNRKSTEYTAYRWNHLRPVFGHLRAAHVTSDHIRAYVDQRQSEGAANGTINRELAALKRMFHLAYQATPPKVLRIPAFPARLKESDPRAGFVSDTQRDALAHQCAREGLWMRTLFEIASTFGWRKGELIARYSSSKDSNNSKLRVRQGLRVRQIDMAGAIRLDTSKNGKGRTVTFDPASPLGQLLSACIADKKADDPVFTRGDGSEVLDFRRAWQKACIAAGLGKMVCRRCDTEECPCDSEKRETKYLGLLVHDLRRSAARDLRRVGVPEHLVMEIGGWKTRSVLDRYSIASEGDVRDALKKLSEHRERSRFGHVSKNDEAGTGAQPQLN
jgi:hypothetical protein